MKKGEGGTQVLTKISQCKWRDRCTHKELEPNIQDVIKEILSVSHGIKEGPLMAGDIEHFTKADGWLKSNSLQSKSRQIIPGKENSTVDESQAQGLSSYKEWWAEKNK